ncbi:MAG: type I restriction enzyme HsdR N-terminal domain-containing protein [Muribaculaceae bacterium]|nr:type I restriction enzyme HsdR N-terminal domain-containing protein [Muribaculaceae bacterium]
MPKLNLPNIQAQIRTCDDGVTRIYDPLRRKFVALTPEEWVRQHFTAYMIDHCGYPSGLMANEVSIKLNDTLKRCDTVLFDMARRPMLIVEYKAPHIAITQRVFDQIVRYNMVLKARMVVVSNGLSHYCCEIDYSNHTYRFAERLPQWQEWSEQ